MAYVQNQYGQTVWQEDYAAAADAGFAGLMQSNAAVIRQVQAKEAAEKAAEEAKKAQEEAKKRAEQAKKEQEEAANKAKEAAAQEQQRAAAAAQEAAQRAQEEAKAKAEQAQQEAEQARQRANEIQEESAKAQAEAAADAAEQRAKEAAEEANRLAQASAPKPEEAGAAEQPQSVVPIPQPGEPLNVPPYQPSVNAPAGEAAPYQPTTPVARAEASRATDGQTLAEQTQWTRDAFRYRYGDRADIEWAREHERELERNRSLYGTPEPKAGTAPIAGAPAGTPVAPNRTIGAVEPPKYAGPGSSYGGLFRNPDGTPAYGPGAQPPVINPVTAAPSGMQPQQTTRPEQPPRSVNIGTGQPTPAPVPGQPVITRPGTAPTALPSASPRTATLPPNANATAGSLPVGDITEMYPPGASAQRLPPNANAPAGSLPQSDIDAAYALGSRPTAGEPGGPPLASGPVWQPPNYTPPATAALPGAEEKPPTAPIPPGVVDPVWVRGKWDEHWEERASTQTNPGAYQLIYDPKQKAEQDAQISLTPYTGSYGKSEVANPTETLTPPATSAAPPAAPTPPPAVSRPQVATPPAQQVRTQPAAPVPGPAQQTPPPDTFDPVMQASTSPKPISEIIRLATPNAAGLTPEQAAQQEKNVLSGISAMLQGKREGVWAEPYLNDVARLAWAREERNAGRVSDPRTAPVEYIEKWKDAFFGSDPNVPLVKELDQQMIDMGVARARATGQPFNWKASLGDSGVISRQIASNDCGPNAFSVVLRSHGINLDPTQAFEFARKNGYHNGVEFAGPQAMARMISETGISASTHAVDWNVIDSELAQGRIVLLSSRTHWWAISSKDPTTGKYYAGATASVAGNPEWATPGDFAYAGARPDAMVIQRGGEVNPNAKVVTTYGLKPAVGDPSLNRAMLSTQTTAPVRGAAPPQPGQVAQMSNKPAIDLPPIIRGGKPQPGLVAGQSQGVDQMARVWEQAHANTGDKQFADGLAALLIGEGGMSGGVGDKGQSFGPFQFYWGGGEGNGFEAWLRQTKGFSGSRGEAQQMAKDVDLALEYYLPRVKGFYDKGTAMGYTNPVQAIAAGGHNAGAPRDRQVWQHYQDAWNNWNSGNTEQQNTVQSTSARAWPNTGSGEDSGSEFTMMRQEPEPSLENLRSYRYQSHRTDPLFARAPLGSSDVSFTTGEPEETVAPWHDPTFRGEPEETVAPWHDPTFRGEPEETVAPWHDPNWNGALVAPWHDPTFRGEPEVIVAPWHDPEWRNNGATPAYDRGHELRQPVLVEEGMEPVSLPEAKPDWLTPAQWDEVRRAWMERFGGGSGRMQRPSAR